MNATEFGNINMNMDPFISVSGTHIILLLNSCPNPQLSNRLASLLYYQSIPASVRHINPYAVILTDLMMNRTLLPQLICDTRISWPKSKQIKLKNDQPISSAVL